MAMVGNDLGAAWWSAIKAYTGATYTGPQDAQGQEIWNVIANTWLTYYKANAVIIFTPGDLTIPGTGLMDSMSAPVTGNATNSGVTLSNKLG